MLPKTAKKILLHLIENNFNFNGTDEIVKKLNLQKQAVIDNLLYLHNEDYINCIDSDEDILRVYPLHKGLYYHEVRAAERKAFIYRSIITPIAISVITTILTMFCTKILAKWIK